MSSPAPTFGSGPAPLTVALLLADARLPGGGHAHSAGLEPALQGGMNPALSRAYLVGRATTVSLVEAGTAVVTSKTLATDPTDHVRLHRVVRAWAARTPAPAHRDAARLLGRGYLRAARELWADHPAVEALVAADTAGRHLPRAVVIGAIAAASGVSPEDVVRLTVYEDAQAAASALLRLEPLDPLVPTRWVLDACSAAEPFVARVAACTQPEDIPASGAPQTEGWAQTHSLTTQRLFRA